MNGIDISNNQGFMTPHDLPIDFCICKATEGIGWTDEFCDGFIQDCIENNILWGFYHFARENEPEQEAEWFYNECRNYFGRGIPVLDYETRNYNDCEWCERFLNRLHELSDIWAMLYISAGRCGAYENSWIPEKCGLWVAGYPYEITRFEDAGEMNYNIYPWKFAAIWQFTSSLIIKGFWEKLDGDIAYMDREAWMRYANPDANVTSYTLTKTIDDLVVETLLGEYGDGEDRKRLLADKYELVQNRINELYAIADEVIAGKWGDGWNRENALNGAGYPYSIVQKIVNDKLA